MAKTRTTPDPEPADIFTDGTYSPETVDPGSGVMVYPTAGAYIPGVPAVAHEVDAATAAGLLAYSPPAFTTDPTEAKPEINPLEEAPAEPASEPAAPEEGSN